MEACDWPRGAKRVTSAGAQPRPAGTTLYHRTRVPVGARVPARACEAESRPARHTARHGGPVGRTGAPAGRMLERRVFSPFHLSWSNKLEV